MNRGLRILLQQRESGQDLIEYALIAGFISVVCYVAIQATGVSINGLWNQVSAAVVSA